MAAAALADGGLRRAHRLRPAPADEFVASVGLCVHLAGEVYAEMFNRVLRLARDLGIRHFRDDLRPTDDLGRWRALFDEAGVRAHLLSSPTTNTSRELLDYVGGLGESRVSAVEGQNEGDGPWFRAQPGARPTWNEAVVAHQRAIYTALRARYPQIPIVSPTVLDYRPRDMGALRAAAPYCDFVAVHAYVQAQQHPETSDDFASLEWYLRKICTPFKPGAPVMVTEAGYFNGLDGVSARTAAIYLPRLLLNAFDQGVSRTFLYEFFDEGRDAKDSEQNYGLVSVDGVPKSAYYALQILLRTLSDPGPAFSAAPATVGIGTAPSDVRLCVFAKRDGSFVLALWRALPIWDNRGRRDLPLQPVEVDLQFGRPPTRISHCALWPEAEWRDMPSAQTVTIEACEIVTLVRFAF